MERKIYPLETHKLMQELHDRRYKEAQRAKEVGKKVVWLSGLSVGDIAVAMDFIPYFPENHATLCGVKKVSTELCEVAEAHDYNCELCSYSRNDLGSYFTGGVKSPYGMEPSPDLLISATLCNQHVKWFEELSRLYNVPLLLLDTPLIHDNLSTEDRDRIVKYVRDQLKEFTEFMADYCHRPYNWDRLQECIGYTGQGGRLYGEIAQMARHRPSPITVFDLFLHMEPLLDWRGFPELPAYYEELKKEVAHRVEQGFSAIGEEKYRLYWDNLPIWFRFGHLARMFASYGACVLCGVFPESWVTSQGSLDPSRPLESIAEAQSFVINNLGTGQKCNDLAKMVEDYSIDGLVMQMSHTCKLYITEQYAIMKEVERRTGVAGVILEGDMVDSRLYSDADVDSIVEGFMKVLESRAEGKG